MNTYLKLFIQTFGIFFITLTAGAYLYLTTINELYNEKVKFKLSNDKERIISHIQNIEKEVTKNALLISEDKKIIELLSFIDNDPTNTKTLEQLLSYTNNVIDKKESFLILLFDDTGYSLVKNGIEFHTPLHGYTLKENTQRYFISNATKTPINEESIFTQSKCLTRLNSNFKENQLGFCFTHEILKNQKVVGYVKVAYFLDKKDLIKLNQTLNYPIYFDAGKNKEIKNEIKLDENSKIVDSLVYDGNTKLYANHVIDETAINHEKNTLYIEFISICLIALILAFFIAQLTTKLLFLKPLIQLQKSIQAIKNHENYEEIITSKDEFATIADEFNHLFKELSDTASYNNAYINSINDTNLVSKTDLKGIITYSNELFEKTSVYQKDDLIGKPHSIVRHPDMPKEAFKNLWETIKDGQIWRGIVEK